MNTENQVPFPTLNGVYDDRFKFYQKRAVQPMRPYIAGEDMTGITVNPVDAAAGVCGQHVLRTADIGPARHSV